LLLTVDGERLKGQILRFFESGGEKAGIKNERPKNATKAQI